VRVLIVWKLIEEQHQPRARGKLVGWLVYSYTDPPRRHAGESQP